MRNCIILGSGRSGTSMLAGLFRQAGYFMGDQHVPPREANPLGFFEDREINAINEELLSSVTPPRPTGPLRALPVLRRRLAFSQRWLAEVPVNKTCKVTPTLTQRMEVQVATHENYCFKDPRFCYTLPAWRPHLRDTVYLCVFRDPTQTAMSMLREAREAPYLKNVRLDYDRALRVWLLMYRHVLERHCLKGDWLFVHYDQVVNGAAVAAVERAVGARLDAAFPDETISRSRPAGECPAEVARVYRRLLELSRDLR